MIDFKNEKLLVIAPHADDEILGPRKPWRLL